MAPGLLIEDEWLGVLARTTSGRHEKEEEKKKERTITSPVLDASLITQDFDPLRFQAAASLQLLQGPFHITHSKTYNLISSPYNHPSHLLDLNTLTHQTALFAKSLTVLTPTTPNYAYPNVDYTLTFNWPIVLSTLRTLLSQENQQWTTQSFYTVIFQSKLKEDVDLGLLYDLDRNSHAEATLSGGLLKYWFGSCDGENRNLATCIWRSREDARLGGLGPWHKKARLAARELYASFSFTVRKFTILDGAMEFRVEEWDA